MVLTFKILLLSLVIFSNAVNCLPDMYCNPLFQTITKLVNNSYFITDTNGNYWIASDDQKISVSSKTGNILNLKTLELNNEDRDFNSYNFQTFDSTFILNFDSKCRRVVEHLYGLNFETPPRFALYRYGNWIIRLLKPNDMLSYVKDLNNETDFLSFANTNETRLSLNLRINAILSFKDRGMFIIQRIKTLYIYCDQTNGWQLDENAKLIEFNPKYSINYDEIYDGFVDNERQLAYLFEAEKSSSGEYVRKRYHNCTVSYTDMNKISLNCSQQNYSANCVRQSFWEKNRKLIIIIGVISVIIIVLIMLICIGLSFYLSRSDSFGNIDDSEPKTLTDSDTNSEKVVVANSFPRYSKQSSTFSRNKAY